ncbi:MAG TPA: ComEC/Rec2 family competence protein [Patescibacteria group bacterium]
MTKSKIFLILSLSFIGGIFLASLYQRIIADYYFLLAVVLLLIPLIIFYPVRNDQDVFSNGASKNKIVYIAVFTGLFFIFGFWLTGIKISKINDTSLNGQIFSGQALIVKETENTGKFQKIIIKLSGDNNLKVLLNASLYPEYKYGYEVNLKCKLEAPENFAEGFDYRMYLAKDGIYYVCSGPKIELLNRDKGNKFYSSLLRIKNKFNNNINRLIPFPQAGLLSGLILGGSGGLSKDLQNNFSRTGMTHIVAVSGYNVTIVAEYLMLLGIFLGLWRKQAFWFAVFGILLFVLMTGMTASAVRAGVMGTLLLWAMKNGRLANSQNAIVFAAAIMLFFNPLLLRYDIGFQLSFLATIGIIYIYPMIEGKLNRNSKIFWIWEILFLSLSAQIFVLPIILYNFQTLSLLSLVANVLILPIIPLTMLLGFLMAISNFIFTPLATVLAWLTYTPLKYEVEIIQLLGNLKYSALEIKNFPWWGVVIWYIILIQIIIFFQRSKETLNNQDILLDNLVK